MTAHGEPPAAASIRVRRTPVRPLLGVHPAVILAVLDVVGLLVASYLSVVEVGGGVPVCGPLHGCEEVARSTYSRIGGVPVAVYGVGLSLILLSCALAWWRTNLYVLLLAHYGLSLAGVLFEGYFLYLELFVIGAVCVWCTTYGLSLVLRFVIALVVWIRQQGVAPEDVQDVAPEDVQDVALGGDATG